MYYAEDSGNGDECVRDGAACAKGAYSQLLMALGQSDIGTAPAGAFNGVEVINCDGTVARQG